ncbi:MAG: Xaa-Pro aminopeptidase [Kangiellaceae bacterium]|nr:Xaa-Pro aminopeptidase [Kangiellaceae bacterium]|tara:strand:+ start:11432 stop:12751 length:1320 start_codon:yes stop_codon:yes gene_type:complete
MQATPFEYRRKQLLDKMPPHTAAVIGAAKEKSRNRDAEYPFRQDSDFFYLTGFNEPEAWLVLVKGEDYQQSVLFNRAKNLEQEIWTGIRLGQEQALVELQVDQAFALDEMPKQWLALFDGLTAIYYDFSRDDVDGAIKSCLRKMAQMQRTGVKPPRQLNELSDWLHELRLVKSDEEVAIMRKSAQISAEAHCRAMQACQAGMFEYQIEAEIIHHFMHNGARQPAYESIVAGGENACILHYTQNRSVLADGDLLLIDAGAEWNMYAADITRTFPVSGKFSPIQHKVYTIVLNAQRAAIDAVSPESSFDDYHQAAVRVITQGLIELGVLQGDFDALIKDEAYKPYYMHKTGHWLGMDVHDVGAYKTEGAFRQLKPGMVLTVEPGLYFGLHLKGKVADELLGIGIRIEDDVLVTDAGCEILTDGVPKDIDAIESLMSGGVSV